MIRLLGHTVTKARPEPVQCGALLSVLSMSDMAELHSAV